MSCNRCGHGVCSRSTSIPWRVANSTSRPSASSPASGSRNHPAVIRRRQELDAAAPATALAALVTRASRDLRHRIATGLANAAPGSMRQDGPSRRRSSTRGLSRFPVDDGTTGRIPAVFEWDRWRKPARSNISSTRHQTNTAGWSKTAASHDRAVLGAVALAMDHDDLCRRPGGDFV